MQSKPACDEIAATQLSTHSLRPASRRIPEQFGRYRILDVLGGGMGTCIPPTTAARTPRRAESPFAGDDVSSRGSSGKIAAGFNERHLCPVYDVGEIEGVPS